MIRTLRLAPTILFLLSATLHAQTTRPMTAVEKYGQLSVKGNQIVDQHGQPVQLHGVSLFWSQWIPKYYNASCVRWLRDDWNCEVVRVAMAVRQGGYLEHPEEEMKRVDAVVQAAIDNGVYVIVNWHVEDDPAPEEAQKFFATIAGKYGKYPNIIYEPWNEPSRSYDWGESIRPYHEAVAAKIREKDPNNLIVCGTRSWCQDVDRASGEPVQGNNIAYAVHFYAATNKQELRNKCVVAMDNGIALFVTECSASEGSGTGNLDEAEMRLWWQFLTNNHIGWCAWTVADKPESSCLLKPRAAPDGGWTEDMLSDSGKLVRDEIRKSSSTTMPSL